MNKCQEALNNLENIICDLSCELKQDYELYTRETGYEKYIYILQELVDTVNLLKSKLYLPEENECDTLDDGSKVYMIYAKGVLSEEEYKALKEVLNMEKVNLSPRTLEAIKEYNKNQQLKEMERKGYIPGIHIEIESKGVKPKGLSICPNCENHLYINQKYCDECGQKLDWSDE